MISTDTPRIRSSMAVDVSRRAVTQRQRLVAIGDRIGGGPARWRSG